MIVRVLIRKVWGPHPPPLSLMAGFRKLFVIELVRVPLFRQNNLQMSEAWTGFAFLHTANSLRTPRCHTDAKEFVHMLNKVVQCTWPKAGKVRLSSATALRTSCANANLTLPIKQAA